MSYGISRKQSTTESCHAHGSPFLDLTVNSVLAIYRARDNAATIAYIDGSYLTLLLLFGALRLLPPPQHPLTPTHTPNLPSLPGPGAWHWWPSKWQHTKLYNSNSSSKISGKKVHVQETYEAQWQLLQSTTWEAVKGEQMTQSLDPNTPTVASAERTARTCMHPTPHPHRRARRRGACSKIARSIIEPSAWL